MKPYVDHDEGFKCPSETGYDDDSPYGLNDLERYESWWTIYGCSYLYNAGGETILSPGPYLRPVLWGRSIDEVLDPSMLLTIGDYTWRYARFGVFGGHPLGLIAISTHAHDQNSYTSNIAFLDGHGEMLLIQPEINTEDYETDPFNY